MSYIICLESKKGLVTKEQVFTCSLLQIISSNLKSNNKISVICPIDFSNRAIYNKLLKYDTSLQDEFISNFIEMHGLELSFAVLATIKDKKLEHVINLKLFLSDILLTAYADEAIEPFIKIVDVEKTITQFAKNIRKNILVYYASISQDIN